MTSYQELSREELQDLLAALNEEYETYQEADLKLNMARGKPAAAQLDLSMPMLDLVSSNDPCLSEDGTDLRNYGVLDGIPEAKEFLSIMLEEAAPEVVVGGNSSLNLMYDAFARCMFHGTLGSTPWVKYDTIKWICPVPGYDRHFTITNEFCVEMIPVPMTPTGPDMDEVECIAVSDDSVKGIWCVPKYANPTGVTYSDETVRRLASMECAAEDFRIFWDNAYCVHHLYDDKADQDQLLDIGIACRESGNPDRYYKFASTSKITFPGSGLAGFAASPANVADVKKHLSAQTIGHDKLNQMRHARFLKDAEGLRAHMAKHAAIIRPKFELVDRKLAEKLEGTGAGQWTDPRGGYFISFDAPEGTASRIVTLAKGAGVVMTGAGATWPLGNDPYDSNIRIAPTLPPLEELETAMDVFTCCVKIATIEKLLEA